METGRMASAHAERSEPYKEKDGFITLITSNAWGKHAVNGLGESQIETYLTSATHGGVILLGCGRQQRRFIQPDA